MNCRPAFWIDQQKHPCSSMDKLALRPVQTAFHKRESRMASLPLDGHLKNQLKGDGTSSFRGVKAWILLVLRTPRLQASVML